MFAVYEYNFTGEYLDRGVYETYEEAKEIALDEANKIASEWMDLFADVVYEIKGEVLTVWVKESESKEIFATVDVREI